MTDAETYRVYLQTVVEFIKEDALNERDLAKNSTGEDRVYHRGVQFGFYSVLSTLRQHAPPLGITLEEISLADLDPDKELL